MPGSLAAAFTHSGVAPGRGPCSTSARARARWTPRPGYPPLRRVWRRGERGCRRANRPGADFYRQALFPVIRPGLMAQQGRPFTRSFAFRRLRCPGVFILQACRYRCTDCQAGGGSADVTPRAGFESEYHGGRSDNGGNRADPFPIDVPSARLGDRPHGPGHGRLCSPGLRRSLVSCHAFRLPQPLNRPAPAASVPRDEVPRHHPVRVTEDPGWTDVMDLKPQTLETVKHHLNPPSA